MAVIPTPQRQGIGSMLLKEAVKQARAWPADAIRLDAFDADAGAGAFLRQLWLPRPPDLPQSAPDLL